jgi:hypothetical protein
MRERIGGPTGLVLEYEWLVTSTVVVVVIGTTSVFVVVVPGNDSSSRDGSPDMICETRNSKANNDGPLAAPILIFFFAGYSGSKENDWEAGYRNEVPSGAAKRGTLSPTQPVSVGNVIGPAWRKKAIAIL